MKPFPRLKIHLVRRESAEGYMLLTLVSFAASVTVTRLFLSLTGYPQIGSGELHFAHVLWGGLLLYMGALILLIFSNSGVYPIAAIFTGFGVGLFIDEVGKFITQSNNYFYPPAAPIIYAFFLLSIMVLLHIRSALYSPRYKRISQALQAVSESLNKVPVAGTWARVISDLKSHLVELDAGPRADLVRALLNYTETVEAAQPASTRKLSDLLEKFGLKVNVLITTRWLKSLLIVGLSFMGLVMLKNPISWVSRPWFAGRLSVFLDNLHLGGQIVMTGVAGWLETRLTLEVMLGITMLVAGFLMMGKRWRLGVMVGIYGLILSLTTIDLLLFYFEQFSTIITSSIHFLILAGLWHFRDRMKEQGKQASYY